MSVLEGRHVLLVEDESLVAMLAEDMLIDLGCEVTVAMRLDKALAIARTGSFDLAVLDVNLGVQRSYPIADVLFERGVRFLFATGYGFAGLELPYRTVPVVQKPYRLEQMHDILSHTMTCKARPRKGASVGPACECRWVEASSRRFAADGFS
ncbi:MAG: response regulator [Methylobacterium sp.]